MFRSFTKQWEHQQQYENWETQVSANDTDHTCAKILAFLYHGWFSFIVWRICWSKKMSPSDKKSVWSLWYLMTVKAYGPLVIICTLHDGLEHTT